MQTILIVEDEKDLAELLCYHLEREGYRTVTAHDGIAGLQAALDGRPDLVVLDLMLPGLLGTEVCKALKRNAKTADIPVLMLTAKGEEIDKVVGFEVGAEDYVVKPFSTRELLLRVKVLLRRRSPGPLPDPVLCIGGLTVDVERHLVLLAGVELSFTSTEFKLLHILMQRRGRVQSREVLLRDVWGYNFVDDTRTVDTHITRLRTKLGEAGEMIRTVRGFGYKIDEHG